MDISRWTDPVPRGVGTVSGLVLALLKRPPRIGDVMDWNDLRLEIIDMDGPKIDRLLIQQLHENNAEPPSSTAPPDERNSND